MIDSVLTSAESTKNGKCWEVRNTFTAYEELPNWSAHSRKDLLAAHELLMAGLVDETGCFRSGGVGIQKGSVVVHMAPPASQVSRLMDAVICIRRNGLRLCYFCSR